MTDTERLDWLERSALRGTGVEIHVTSAGTLVTVARTGRKVEFLGETVREAIDAAWEQGG